MKSKIQQHDRVYVKNSRIHGRGLFAKTRIKQGEILGEVSGSPTDEDGPYVLWINDAQDGFEVKCIFKYINHAKNANACYCDDLSVIALRDIEPDEEITHDYGVDWDE